MSSASSIITTMLENLTDITNQINPNSSQSAKLIHSTTLDKDEGITHSAFEGQHSVALGSDGVNVNSSEKVTNTAPVLSHNGKTTVSDMLSVAKGAIASSFGLASDAKLKRNIKEWKPTIEELKQIGLYTFDVKPIHWETGAVLHSDERPSVGTIAQIVQKIWPLLVTDNDGYLSLEESKFGLIVGAILCDYVEKTDARIEALEKALSEVSK
jgi:hypothetical protein